MLHLDVPAKVVKEAIELKCSECYGAMRIANALGGSPSDDWKLACKYTLVELLEGAAEMGIDLTGVKSAVMGTPIEDTPAYKEAIAKVRRMS